MLSFIGVFSYSLYLLHIPLWRLSEMFVRNLVPISANLSTPLFLIPSIIILSFLWYLFLEKPQNQNDVLMSMLSPINVFKSGVSMVKENFKFYSSWANATYQNSVHTCAAEGNYSARRVVTGDEVTIAYNCIYVLVN